MNYTETSNVIQDNSIEQCMERPQFEGARYGKPTTSTDGVGTQSRSQQAETPDLVAGDTFYDERDLSAPSTRAPSVGIDPMVHGSDTYTEWGSDYEARRNYRLDCGFIDGAQSTRDKLRASADAKRARCLLSNLPVHVEWWEREAVLRRILRNSRSGRAGLNGFNRWYDGFDGAVYGFALVEVTRLDPDDIDGRLSCDAHALRDYVEDKYGESGE